MRQMDGVIRVGKKAEIKIYIEGVNATKKWKTYSMFKRVKK